MDNIRPICNSASSETEQVARGRKKGEVNSKRECNGVTRGNSIGSSTWGHSDPNRSPLSFSLPGDPRMAIAQTKARHRGESFRNRIAITGGPENSQRGREPRRVRVLSVVEESETVFRRAENSGPQLSSLSPRGTAEPEVKSWNLTSHGFLATNGLDPACSFRANASRTFLQPFRAVQVNFIGKQNY